MTPGSLSAAALIRAGEPIPCRPHPRHLLSPSAWSDLARALRTDPTLAFAALWADPTHIHALFNPHDPLLASVPVEAGLYAALSPARPAAALFERIVADLWGHRAADALDTRPALDHGTWPTLHPLADRPVPNAALSPEPLPPEPLAPGTPGYSFGPLPPAPAAPAHWRLTLAGPRIAAVDPRFGYTHRGILGLMRGKSPGNAARLAARIDAAATVAHSTAFARAVEAASDTPPPPAAAALRDLLLALERIAAGLHDLHATADALHHPHPAAAHARETLLQACADLTGHRLLLDTVRPGGVTIDPDAPSLARLDDALASLPPLRHTWPAIGALSLADAHRLALPGPFGRAAGRPDPADPGAPLRTEGTLAARMTLLSAAIATDVENARNHLANIPKGPTAAILPHATAEGLGAAATVHGPVWHWVRLANGIVAANFAATPTALALPALQSAAPGLDPADLPALAASFALRPPSLDL